MDFLEELPVQCPPNDAKDQEFKVVFRLIERKPITEEAFKSHAALGKKPPPNMHTVKDLCRWASCSLVFDAKKQKKLPRFKDYTLAASIAIPIGAGYSNITGSNHVDFWCGKSFNMILAVKEIVEI